jgi:hypothetical protein
MPVGSTNRIVWVAGMVDENKYAPSPPVVTVAQTVSGALGMQ